jgi:hypothetical protein
MTEDCPVSASRSSRGTELAFARRESPRALKFKIAGCRLQRAMAMISERQQMSAGLLGEPSPITAMERAEWIARFDGICFSSDAYIPFRDNMTGLILGLEDEGIYP